MACVPPLELWCSGNAKDWRDALALEEEAIASVAKRGKTLLAICVYSVYVDVFGFPHTFACFDLTK